MTDKRAMQTRKRVLDEDDEDENRSENCKRQLREENAILTKKVTTLETNLSDLQSLLLQKDAKIKFLEDEKNKLALSQKLLEEKLKNTISELEQTNRSLQFRNNEISNIRRENQKKDELNDFLRKQWQASESSSTEILRESALAKTAEVQMRKKSLEMKNQLSALKLKSPSGGAKLKKYGDIRKNDTKFARVKRTLECLKTDIGEQDLDAFITDFCNYVAKNPTFSFKTCLTAMESFVAVVKFKFSDTMLKDLKSFLTDHLGHDIFVSRKEIDDLKKLHSTIDDYDITTREMVKKVGSREVTVKSAVVKARDVSSLIKRRLERLSDNNMLRFKNESDPVKIGFGGDKGGSHTKLVISFGNIDTPNNPHSLLLIGMFEGSDDYKSLDEHMASAFEMVNQITSLTYKEHGIEVTRPVLIIPNGDCKYLSAILGHPGQAFSTPCFSCKLSWSCRAPHATLLGDFDFSIQADQYEPSDLKRPLLNVEPSSVAPPALHFILGIVQSYVMNPLVALCNVLDYGDELPEDLKDQKKMLRSLEQEQQEYSDRVESLQCSLRTIDSLLEVVEKTKTSAKKTIDISSKCEADFCLIPFCRNTEFRHSDSFVCDSCNKTIHNVCCFVLDTSAETSTTCLDCRFSFANLEDRFDLLSETREKTYQQLDNDYDVLKHVKIDREKLQSLFSETKETRKRLEAVLESIGCGHRTWYQQLTGNQARKLLREENIRRVLSVFPPNSSDKLQLIEDIMIDLSRIMSAGDNREKTDEEIDEIQEILWNLESNMKTAFPSATVTPKLHLLFAHWVPFLRIHRSLGHLTEQGLEHMHAIANSLHAKFAAVTNPEAKAALIVKHFANFNYLFDTKQSWFKCE
ncbi:hypothetical protein CRE_27752 [Caenorhabditis remanei]|uniref:Zinc finger PHD-type domain-containing protein n=1 Tax=Caenorhabditis remanei TaxID=31234 RepID=E3MXR4_CAERE|nr:hypothetical protein CRE_27752 [Caenorhabditis remanei]